MTYFFSLAEWDHFPFFFRNIQFFGFEFQRKVSDAYVVVVGLGGVGSHAASMLLRSGIGRLLLVDFDQVPLSMFLKTLGQDGFNNLTQLYT